MSMRRAAWAFGVLVLASDAAFAQPPCPSAAILGSAVFEKVAELPVTCQEQIYEQVIADSIEPDASLARNNLAILLTTKQTTAAYRRAADLVEHVVLPAPGIPDKQFDLLQRIQLRLSRARVYDFADQQDKALDAYHALLRDGGDADSIFAELVQCSRRYLGKAPTGPLDPVMTIALTLEDRSDSGQGQTYLRELERDSAARARLANLSLRLYASRPPSDGAFNRYHKPRILEMLRTDSCTRADSSVLCDVLRAFCRSVKCERVPRDLPYTSSDAAAADFPATAALAAESSDTATQLQGLLLKLAGRLAIERPKEALVLSSAAWFLDKQSTRAGRQLAALVHDLSMDANSALKTAMVAYYTGSPGKLSLERLKEDVPQRTQGIDLENVLNIYRSLEIKGVKALEAPITKLIYELSTLMPETLEDLANLVRADESELAIRLFRLAQAQYLAVGAEAQAMRVASALADLDPTISHRASVYGGQTTIIGTVPRDLRGRTTQVQLRGWTVSDTCTFPDTANPVYVCHLSRPLRDGELFGTVFLGTSGARLSTIRQVVLPTRTTNGIALPAVSDRYIEGWLKPERTASVVKVTVLPPACAPESRTLEASVIRAPEETFFSVLLPRRLSAGERVSVSMSTSDSDRRLADLDVRPDEYNPSDARTRMYSRFAVGYLQQTSGSPFAPVVGATGDWALRATSVPPPGCAVHAANLFSFHVSFDFAYSDQIPFIRLADRAVLTKYSVPLEIGLYAPVSLPFAAWRAGGRPYSIFAAPLVRAGGNFNIAPPSGSSGSGHFHSLLAGGVRVGVRRHVEYTPDAKPSNDYLLGHLDITTGRFSNYALPQDDGSTQVPRRTNIRVALTIPHTKLLLEASRDFGGSLPTYSRVLIGYRGEVIQTLIDRSRRWF